MQQLFGNPRPAAPAAPAPPAAGGAAAWGGGGRRRPRPCRAAKQLAAPQAAPQAAPPLQQQQQHRQHRQHRAVQNNVIPVQLPNNASSGSGSSWQGSSSSSSANVRPLLDEPLSKLDVDAELWQVRPPHQPHYAWHLVWR